MKTHTGKRMRVLLWWSIAVSAFGCGVIVAAIAGLTFTSAAEPAPGTEAAGKPAGFADVEPGSGSVRETDSALESDVEPAGISALPAAPWVAETAERFGIPERAVAAYAGAAMRLAGEQPSCGLDWATLAGIGHVESAHGTIHGGTINADGQQTPAVFGIALDGTVTDRITDTDGGALDDDPVWDRAVGPMQIIPETWMKYRADGNDDGMPDPQHIDDAALTAARYLCAVGVDLRTPDGWIAAISAYNNTVSYNNLVADATSYYRTG